VRAQGNCLGLRPSVAKQIDRLHERRVGAEAFVDPHFALALHDAALAAGRRIGVLADRRGAIHQVIVGDATTLDLPPSARKRTGVGRLNGLRLVHATLADHGHTTDDLQQLRMLSLDASIAVLAGEEGHMPRVEVAYLLPANDAGRMWEVLRPARATAVAQRFDETVRDLEVQMRRDLDALRGGRQGERTTDAAIVVLPVLDRATDVDWELSELKALCRTAGVAVAGTVVQRRDRPDPRTLVGRGKLRELTMAGLQKGADLLVFGAPLTPSQQRSVAADTGVRVIDRNQLILSIFALHARTNEGKLQVELAQLRYNLPRLSERDDAMSRLTGGIGATGPGETKLEMERRRARERIHMLEGRIAAISRERAQRRQRREGVPVPMVAIVGYTNAGKSTLFNVLTGAGVDARDRLFATLDPTIRRVRLGGGTDFLLCDTVGFIRDLPQELIGAFRATIEEVATARVLLHVADGADPHVGEQVAAVRRILADLSLDDRPSVLVLNKADLAPDRHDLALRAASMEAIATSAREPESLKPVIDALAAACAL
jgi:GTP-binding protein HflX